MDETFQKLMEASVKYTMKTIDGTRLRAEHSTLGNVLLTIPAGTTLEGYEIFVADMDLSYMDHVYQAQGDVWVKVNYKDFEGWVAFVHMGKAICTDFQELDEEKPDDIVLKDIEVQAKVSADGTSLSVIVTEPNGLTVASVKVNGVEYIK